MSSAKTLCHLNSLTAYMSCGHDSLLVGLCSLPPKWRKSMKPIWYREERLRRTHWNLGQHKMLNYNLIMRLPDKHKWTYHLQNNGLEFFKHIHPAFGFDLEWPQSYTRRKFGPHQRFPSRDVIMRVLTSFRWRSGQMSNTEKGPHWRSRSLEWCLWMVYLAPSYLVLTFS